MNNQRRSGVSRRDFVKGTLFGAAAWPLSRYVRSTASEVGRTRIALCKTGDRRAGVGQVMKLLQFDPVAGRKVLVKPNFNTADPAPGSTHNDTLHQIILELQQRNAAAITVGDRCGPAKMPEVLAAKQIPEMAAEAGFDVVDFGALPDADWLPYHHPALHWENGFTVPRPLREAEYIVTTPCLKTHQYGGVFTMSLKLSVGVTPRSLMRELHRSEHMRRMIAEINLAYTPRLIVMDGVECFVDGGPMTGKSATAGVILAGTDRVAVDAVGLAVLREVGANDAIMGTPVFRQEQIIRAVELGLGVGAADQIEFVTADRESELYARKLTEILRQS